MSKQVIKVTKNQLEEIRDFLEGGLAKLGPGRHYGYFRINGGDYCAACYYLEKDDEPKSLKSTKR